VIPAFNEDETIGAVIDEVRPFARDIIVVDDGSVDKTFDVAKKSGATVIRNGGKKGYIGAVKTGFKKAGTDVVVTLDADGEHDPRFIYDLAGPIIEGKADLVLGRRRKVDRISERILGLLTRFVVKIHDHGTGMRAMRRELAGKLELNGRCICGISVLEAHYLGARILEVPIVNRKIDKPRRIAWGHIPQFFIILSFILKKVFSKKDVAKR
jgi:glycosyltransferase involved in cell wall biosynthesis